MPNCITNTVPPAIEEFRPILIILSHIPDVIANNPSLVINLGHEGLLIGVGRGRKGTTAAEQKCPNLG